MKYQVIPALALFTVLWSSGAVAEEPLPIGYGQFTNEPLKYIDPDLSATAEETEDTAKLMVAAHSYLRTINHAAAENKAALIEPPKDPYAKKSEDTQLEQSLNSNVNTNPTAKQPSKMVDTVDIVNNSDGN